MPVEHDEQVQCTTEEKHEEWAGKDEKAQLVNLHKAENTQDDDKDMSTMTQAETM
jgi:hypothetical protein